MHENTNGLPGSLRLDSGTRQEVLKQRLAYSPTTGEFVHLKFAGKGLKGAKAGGKGVNGYLYIGVAKKRYLAHRLAWMFVHGEFPSSLIDHINGDRADNRIDNLRLVDASQNAQNIRKATKANKIGVMGAYARGSAFESKILVRGVLHRLGIFASPEEANAAYINAKRKFHEACTI